MTLTATYYLLRCRVCEPDADLSDHLAYIPFESAALRGKWAAAHTRGLGHDSWVVLDLPPKDAP